MTMAAIKHKIARDPVSQQGIDEILPDPRWSDGRKGFQFARFDALLTEDTPNLRAEVTWMDDSDFKDNETGEPRLFFDPELWIETNQRVGDELRTIDGFVIELSHTEAVAIVMADPCDLLARYTERIGALKDGSKT
jgi:hypothetical protein